MGENGWGLDKLQFERNQIAFWVQEVCHIVLDSIVWTSQGFHVDLSSMGVLQPESVLQEILTAEKSYCYLWRKERQVFWVLPSVL